jgi:hypothetical protein
MTSQQPGSRDAATSCADQNLSADPVRPTLACRSPGWCPTQHVYRISNTLRRTAKASSATSCETPYPTLQPLFGLADGTNFASGYGAGPGCSGLTPSQDNSLYGAPSVGPLNPDCPTGDQCPPEFESYAGDIEVDAGTGTSRPRRQRVRPGPAFHYYIFRCTLIGAIREAAHDQ